MTSAVDQQSHSPQQGHRLIHFHVDDEPFTTEASELTPNVILKDFAGVEPTTHYLVQIRGHEKTSYEATGDVPIVMHDGMRFQVISKGPTPVSDVRND